jgi:hypothetical protein
MIRYLIAATMYALAAFSNVASPADKPAATIYKTPNCGCCEQYANYLRRNGFEIMVKPSHDLTMIRREHGVPEKFAGCHTMLIDGYVVDGHVPLNTLNRLLTERPSIKGITLPGMPQGSPGMTGTKREPFKIYEFGQGKPKVYSVE